MAKVRIYDSKKSGWKRRDNKDLAGKVISVEPKVSGRVLHSSKTTEKIGPKGNAAETKGVIRKAAKILVESGRSSVTVPLPGGKRMILKRVIKDGAVEVSPNPEPVARSVRTARPNFARLTPEELVEREYQRNKLLMDLLAK